MQELNVGAVREILSLKTSGVGQMPKEERRVANGERQGLHTCLTIIATPRQAQQGGKRRMKTVLSVGALFAQELCEHVRE